MRLIALILGLLGVAVASALGASPPVEILRSLEWLADSSAAVCHSEVTSVRPVSETRYPAKTPTAQDRFVRYHYLRLRLVERWKGEAPLEIVADFEVVQFQRVDEQAFPKPGDRFLVFLQTPSGSSDLRTAHMINLRRPGRHDLRGAAISASRDEMIDDGSRIGELVRERLSDHPPALPLPLDATAPHPTREVSPSSALQACFPEVRCRLAVPEDLRERTVERSPAKSFAWVLVASYVNRAEVRETVGARVTEILRARNIQSVGNGSAGMCVSVPADQAGEAIKLLAKAVNREKLQLTLLSPKGEVVTPESVLTAEKDR